MSRSSSVGGMNPLNDNKKFGKVLKVIRQFDSSLATELLEMPAEKLPERLAQSEASLLMNEVEMREDDRFQDAKSTYLALKEPYDEVKKLQRAIITATTLLLHGDIDPSLFASERKG